MHEDVAAALEKLYDERLDEMAVQLAHHFHQAGDHRNAFHYFSLAGERAARLYESNQAITHYTRAIDLAEKVDPDVVSLARLHRGRGLASETVGDFQQARSDHEATLNIADAAGEDQIAWRALLDLGKLWRSRDYYRAKGYFVAALELARRTDDPAMLAASLNWMGNWYANADEPLKAVNYHQEALAIVEQWKDSRELANTLDLLGIVNLLADNLSASLIHYDRAIALFRELDDRPRLITSLMGRASITTATIWLASVPAANVADALNDFKEALQIAREIDSAPDVAWAQWSLGLVYTLQGEFWRALPEIQYGLRISLEIGHREFVVTNRHALGILYTELFAFDKAREELEEALSLAQELNSATMTHLVSGALADVYLKLDDKMSAQVCLKMVISPEMPMDTLGKRLCWVRQAELALAQDDPTLALDITNRLIASASGMAPGRVITYLWLLKAEVLAVIGQKEAALSHLQAAIDNAKAQGERFLQWRIHASLGRLLRTMGHQEAADEEYSMAAALINELAATVPDETLKERFLEGAYSVLGASSPAASTTT